MSTTHAAIDFYAGDDWEIRATLLDENGEPYNLAPVPTIEWALMDRNYNRVINGADVSISVTVAAEGKCAILVPSTATGARDRHLYRHPAHHYRGRYDHALGRTDPCHRRCIQMNDESENEKIRRLMRAAFDDAFKAQIGPSLQDLSGQHHQRSVRSNNRRTSTGIENAIAGYRLALEAVERGRNKWHSISFRWR